MPFLCGTIKNKTTNKMENTITLPNTNEDRNEVLYETTQKMNLTFLGEIYNIQIGEETTLLEAEQQYYTKGGKLKFKDCGIAFFNQELIETSIYVLTQLCPDVLHPGFVKEFEEDLKKSQNI